jgi:glycerol-3-phosphate dehydrogenase
VTEVDLLIVGGGVNGCGIARDAAGRGLKVLLVEQDDLAAHTSSASTKLIHGGLRYLEYYEFRLVREALIERERLLGIAPHIIWPLRFIMPMPPAGRPAWMIRLGLFLYDHLGGRKRLPASEGISLAGPLGAGLKPEIKRGFAYSDCWVEDSRLVVLNAMDARDRGADIRVGTRFLGATRGPNVWIARIADAEGEQEVTARAIVNAAGPWVDRVLGNASGAEPERAPRLVKGSHIIVPRGLAQDEAFILQNPDQRIVFAIPYETDFTLIGTTDVAWHDDPAAPVIDDEEIAYLCESVNRYLADPVTPADIVRTYAGVRPLFDDGSDSAAAVTRDYMLKLGEGDAPQILSVFGGKITTYRRLAEHALEKLAPFLPKMSGDSWTAGAALPGGDIPDLDFERFLGTVKQRWPFLTERTARRLARAYGTRIEAILGEARSPADLGEDLGGGLHTREVDHLVREEWARTADDILWRRSKLGLHVPPGTVERLAQYLA